MRKALVALRDGGLYLAFAAVLLFPILNGVWDFVLLADPSLPHQRPLLGFTFSLLDSGGQGDFARTALRLILCGGILAGLLLPHESPLGHKVSWWLLFLLSGSLSVARASDPFQAETEWEFWALLVLFSYLTGRLRLVYLKPLFLGCLYVFLFFLYLQALWVSVPGAGGRVGGIFRHSNALSTLILLVLPVLVWRARESKTESYLCGFLVGTLTGLLIWTGSLTGAVLLCGTLTYWVASPRRLVRVTLLGAVWPVLCNFLGPKAAALGFPLFFLALLLILVLKRGPHLSRSFLFTALGSLLLAVVSFTALTDVANQDGVTHRRDNSMSARIEFYRAGLVLWSKEPLLGHGPRSFARIYPSEQTSIRYFSKFVHCIPLEFLLEWGIIGAGLAFFALGVTLKKRRTWLTTCEGKAVGWSTLLFTGHCLTGVQSQYPYLFCLVVFMWLALQPPPPERERSETWKEGCCRVVLVVVILALFGLNLNRLSSRFNFELGLETFRRLQEKGEAPASVLMEQSLHSLPLEGENWLQWGYLKQRTGSNEEAYHRADLASMVAPVWAAPLELQLSTKPLSATTTETVSRALRIDPVNYPSFYRAQAELLLKQGEPEKALTLLREVGRSYTAAILDRLPDFRAQDLAKQLVDFWLLVAILEEREGRKPEAERAFRLALYHADSRLSRLSGMVEYPVLHRIEVGSMVGDLLTQVGGQIPAENLPSSVDHSLR